MGKDNTDQAAVTGLPGVNYNIIRDRPHGSAAAKEAIPIAQRRFTRSEAALQWQSHNESEMC